MAQLRQDYEKFIERGAEIIVVGPDSQTAFKDYWTNNDLPYIGLPDPKHLVANLYGQQVKLLKAGRMPAMMVIDKAGRIRFKHYANSMADIPHNKAILNLLDKLNEEEEIKASDTAESR
jgi:peroxiredoxin